MTPTFRQTLPGGRSITVELVCDIELTGVAGPSSAEPVLHIEPLHRADNHVIFNTRALFNAFPRVRVVIVWGSLNGDVIGWGLGPGLPTLVVGFTRSRPEEFGNTVEPDLRFKLKDDDIDV